MLLRCVQSAGGSSVIAIGAGCVSDIATREERAGYLGIFSAGTMVGPTSESSQLKLLLTFVMRHLVPRRSRTGIRRGISAGFRLEVIRMV